MHASQAKAKEEEKLLIQRHWDFDLLLWQRHAVRRSKCSVKWLKSAGATWVFTFFFLSLFQREWAERESESSADRAPVHASSFIFDNIHGGIGLLWIWSEIFQRGVGVGLGSSAEFSLCFREMKHTWFPAFPLIRWGFVPNATGPSLINLLFI